MKKVFVNLLPVFPNHQHGYGQLVPYSAYCSSKKPILQGRMPVSTHGQQVRLEFFNDQGYAGWIFAFTQSGEPLWERYIVDQRFLPEKLSWLSSVEELEDGRLAAIGTIDTPPDVDAWLIVTDGEGCLEPGCMGELQGYFSDSKSIEETSLKVSIFPNPVSGDDLFLAGFDQLATSNNNASIYIHDYLGRLVRTQAFKQKVEINGLVKGVYLLNIKGNDGQNLGICKFVKS